MPTLADAVVAAKARAQERCPACTDYKTTCTQHTCDRDLKLVKDVALAVLEESRCRSVDRLYTKAKIGRLFGEGLQAEVERLGLAIESLEQKIPEGSGNV